MKLNKFLRGKNVDITDIEKEKIKTIQNAISRYTLTENINVFRFDSGALVGLNFKNKDFDTIKNTLISMKNKTIDAKSFISTSTSLWGKDLGNVLYSIKIPKNNNAGSYIGKISRFRNEREFLIKHSSKFRIGEVTEKTVFGKKFNCAEILYLE